MRIFIYNKWYKGCKECGNIKDECSCIKDKSTYTKKKKA